MKKLFVLLAILTVLSVSASDDMRKMLSSPNPKINSVFFGQSLNTRLDMLDYYDAGSKTFSHDDLFGSDIRIDTLSDRHVRFCSNVPMTIDTYLLTPGKDSLAVSIVTMPVGNNDVVIYVDDIRKGRSLDTYIHHYSDWLTKDALKEVTEATLLANIPFVTASATVDTDNNIVTLTNTSITVPGLDPTIVRLFKPELKLRWDGKKFKP